jgi:hypothetical protein
MKTSAKDTKIGGFIVLCISCAIFGFAIIDLILRGGTRDSTNIVGIGIGLGGILFSINLLRVANKKRNEGNQS